MKPRLQPCTVLVVEDFELYRRFIRSALEPREGLQIVAEASDGLEAIQKAEELKPDLVLIDIGLPKLNGLEAGQHIRRVAPRSTLLFVSQLSSADVIREAFRLGASGYVHKSSAQNDLLPAVEAVLRGDRFISSGLELNEDIKVADINELEQADEIRLRYAAIVESSGDAIIAKTLKGVISAWNPAAQRMLGYTQEEAIGRPIAIIIPPDLQGEEAEIIRRLRAGKRIEHFQTRRVSKEGRSIDVSLTISPIKDGGGRIIGASTIARDITESKRAAAAMRESEERFRLVANTAPVMIWMSGIDKQCTYVNHRWLEFTGRSSQVELASSWAEGIHPDELDRCLETYAKAFDRREPFQMEYRLRRKDGEYRWILDRGVPRFSADGSFVGYIGSAVDVTDHKLAESELALASDRLRLAMESGKSVGWDRDVKSGRDILFGDLQSVFGMPLETFVGRVEDFHRRVHPEDRERIVKTVDHAMESHEPYAAELRVVRPDGTVRWLSARGKFYYSTSGEAERMLGMAVDITERKLTEVALVESEERLRLAVQVGSMYAFEWDVTTDMVIRSGEVTHIPGLAGEPISFSKQEFLARVHPEDLATFTNSIAELTPENPDTKISFRFLCPNGSVLWLERRGHAFFDEQGKMVRMIGMVADITERMRDEEDLSKVSQRLIEAHEEERSRIARELHDDINQRVGLVAANLDQLNQSVPDSANDMGREIQAMKSRVDVFYEVFNACPVGIALEDLKGRPLFVNPALCSMLGFSQEEMLSKHCVEFSPREDAEKDWVLFQQLRDGSIDHYHLDKRYIRRDGSLMWGRLSVSLLNPKSPLVVAMVEDITGKKTAEETLELAAEHVTAVIRCSRDLRFLWVSQGYADLIQRPVDEIVGRPIVDVLGKEAFEALRPYFERVLRGERTSYVQEVEYKSVGRRWISASHIPTSDADGTVNGWVAVVVDMTERRRSEEALKRSERYLSESERLAHCGSWAWDARTREAFWSPELFRILGYDPEKTSPSVSAFLARVHPEDRLPAEQRVKEEALGLDVVSEYRIVLSDGTIKHLQAIGHPVKNGSGEVVEVVGTTVDVTKRKLAEEALATVSQKLIEAQEQERSRIARELHDDINQRLALLGVTLQGLKQDLPSSDVELGRRIGEANQMIADLSEDVQNLSHQLHSPKIELLGLASAAASFCRELSDQQGVKIDFHSENVTKELTPEVSLPLFRVLQEAVRNAIKHSGSSRIQVSLRQEASEVELEVQDSGVGFALEEAIKGRGLGLTSMIERLKVAHGRLSIDSDPQRGTKLHARVPFIPTTKSTETAR